MRARATSLVIYRCRPDFFSDSSSIVRSRASGSSYRRQCVSDFLRVAEEESRNGGGEARRMRASCGSASRRSRDFERVRYSGKTQIDYLENAETSCGKKRRRGLYSRRYKNPQISVHRTKRRCIHNATIFKTAPSKSLSFRCQISRNLFSIYPLWSISSLIELLQLFLFSPRETSLDRGRGQRPAEGYARSSRRAHLEFNEPTTLSLRHPRVAEVSEGPSPRCGERRSRFANRRVTIAVTRSSARRSRASSVAKPRYSA